MIKVDIFSGFLGAGKTTLIKKLVEEAYKETNCGAEFYSFGKYYVNDKIPCDLEEMPKDLSIQKRKLAKLYASQRTTVRKMYHMLPYEYWQEIAIEK